MMKSVKIALSVAGLALLVLAFSSYTELMEKRFERMVLERQQQERVDAARQVAVAREQELATKLQALEAKVNGPSEMKSREQEIERLRGELAAVRAETEVVNQRYEKLARQQRISALGGDFTPALETDLPSASLMGAPDPSLEISPADQARLVQAAVPIASVTAFNDEWGFASLDAGEKSGLSVGMRLAIRRGDQVVGVLEVSSLEPASAIADLLKTSHLASAPEGPKTGDEVITWPLH